MICTASATYDQYTPDSTTALMRAGGATRVAKCSPADTPVCVPRVDSHETSRKRSGPHCDSRRSELRVTTANYVERA